MLFVPKTMWLKQLQINFGILSNLDILKLTVTTFKAMLAETRPGQLSPAFTESTIALATPIFANICA